MVVLLLQSLVKNINGQKNANDNTKVVNCFVSLAASVNRNAYEFIYVNAYGMIFSNTNVKLTKVVTIHSLVPQGTILFKLSSHISPKYVATLITNQWGFHFQLE